MNTCRTIKGQLLAHGDLLSKRTAPIVGQGDAVAAHNADAGILEHLRARNARVIGHVRVGRHQLTVAGWFAVVGESCVEAESVVDEVEVAENLFINRRH